MALYELIIERANGTREQRFTDIPVQVGQEVRIGTDLVTIVARTESASRFAVDSFICVHNRGAWPTGVASRWGRRRPGPSPAPLPARRVHDKPHGEGKPSGPTIIAQTT